MSIELDFELRGAWEWLAILEAPPTPRCLDFPGHQSAGHPITQGALLPPGTRLRRCGRRGRRRRAISRCNGVGGPGRGVRGGWLHRGRLRRRCGQQAWYAPKTQGSACDVPRVVPIQQAIVSKIKCK